MKRTTYQVPELRDENDNIIQEGTFGKHSAFSNSTNDGAFDYILNDGYEVDQKRQAVIYQCLGNGETDKHLNGCFRFLELGKAPAGLNYSYCEEQDQESSADSAKNAVDGGDYAPNASAFEVLR